MTDKELKKELEQFTKQELIEICLSANINRIVERIVDRRINFKIEKELENIDKEFAKINYDKEEYLTDLKYKYKVETDEELFKLMNFEEKMKYIEFISKINNLYDKEDKIYNKENERFKRNYRK